MKPLTFTADDLLKECPHCATLCRPARDKKTDETETNQGGYMILTKEQVKELEEAAKPLVKFLCDNFNPHVTVIVTPTGAEILSGSASVKIEEFIRD